MPANERWPGLITLDVRAIESSGRLPRKILWDSRVYTSRNYAHHHVDSLASIRSGCCYRGCGVADHSVPGICFTASPRVQRRPVGFANRGYDFCASEGAEQEAKGLMDNGRFFLSWLSRCGQSVMIGESRTLNSSPPCNGQTNC